MVCICVDIGLAYKTNRYHCTAGSCTHAYPVYKSGILQLLNYEQFIIGAFSRRCGAVSRNDAKSSVYDCEVWMAFLDSHLPDVANVCPMRVQVQEWLQVAIRCG